MESTETYSFSYDINEYADKIRKELRDRRFASDNIEDPSSQLLLDRLQRTINEIDFASTRSKIYDQNKLSENERQLVEYECSIKEKTKELLECKIEIKHLKSQLLLYQDENNATSINKSILIKKLKSAEEQLVDLNNKQRENNAILVNTVSERNNFMENNEIYKYKLESAEKKIQNLEKIALQERKQYIHQIESITNELNQSNAEKEEIKIKYEKYIESKDDEIESLKKQLMRLEEMIIETTDHSTKIVNK